jgi:hypothetical protein
MSDHSPQSSGAAGTKEIWYGLSSEDATNKLGTTIEKGLSSSEAASRLQTYGKEYFRRRERKTSLASIPGKV